jgi:two-component system chemotaxis sensor kinase CheA
VITELVSDWRTEWQDVERTLRLLVEQQEGDPLLLRSARMTQHVTDVIVRNGQSLLYLENQLDHFKQDLIDDARQLGHASKSIQDDVHRIRMFPFAEACAGLERTVRDLARSTGKQVELIIEGGDIEMDRAVLESLGDPLLHLVRNAVDHGIESPDQRQAAQKNPVGTISVSASLRGSQVDIVVGDDGAGLNLDRIREKVRELQLPTPSDEQQLIRSVFRPGFSTASSVTDVSGRGVGMDVVKSQVEALHGTINVSSEPGGGTRFSLSVPLTLTTLSALFVRVGDQVVALPSSSVNKLTRFQRDDVHSTRGRNVLSLGAAPILVDSLARTMGMTSTSPQISGNRMLGVIIQSGSEQVVFLVDEVLREEEVVIKKLGPRIQRLRFVSGGVLLPSGGVALLLNAPELIKAANGEERLSASVQATATAKKATAPRRRLLVVDDSMTTRSLLKSILQSAGHEVIIAVDGQNAWDKLQREEVEMVVADVDMPIMDGFGLTKQIRGSERLRDLPVVLVTSRDSDEDKARGVEAGADAYVVKSAFDQTNILETIDQLL